MPRLVKWEDVKKQIISLSQKEMNELDLETELVSCIIQKRLELGFSQRKLADMSGLKQSAIARIESFKVIPEIPTIIKLSKPLGLKLALISNK